MTCRESTELGAYLLGALGPAERSAVARHVGGCPYCTAELLALAPLPGLLRHTPLEEVPGVGGTAGARPRPRARGRTRVPAVAVVAAAVALSVAGLVLAVVIGVAGHGGRAPEAVRPPASITLAHTDPSTRVSASAALTPETWGTSIRLTLGHLPPGVVCRLVVHARGGTAETAGTWTSTYAAGSTSGSVPASTSVSPQDITALDVVADTGRVLVTVR